MNDNKVIIDLNNVQKDYANLYIKNIQKVNPNKEIIIIPAKEN